MRVPGTLLVILVLVPGVVMWDRIVESMIFYSVRGVAVTPEQLGIAAEEIFFTAEDGVPIYAC